MAKAKSVGQKKIKKVMHEFKERSLHSGSKKGPIVTNPKQAIAISISEAKKVGAHIPKKKSNRVSETKFHEHEEKVREERAKKNKKKK
jgi:hypothetical protein